MIVNVFFDTLINIFSDQNRKVTNLSLPNKLWNIFIQFIQTREMDIGLNFISNVYFRQAVFVSGYLHSYLSLLIILVNIDILNSLWKLGKLFIELKFSVFMINKLRMRFNLCSLNFLTLLICLILFLFSLFIGILRWRHGAITLLWSIRFFIFLRLRYIFNLYNCGNIGNRTLRFLFSVHFLSALASFKLLELFFFVQTDYDLTKAHWEIFIIW